VRLGDILVARGLVSEADVQRAVEYQTKSGGRLGDILVAMRAISQETIETVLHDAPEAPKKIEATGIDGVELMKLMIKDMYVASRELPTQLADDLGLTVQVVRELIQMAIDRKLVEALGTSGKAVMELRYSLTDTGRRWATEAIEQCRYVGVAPITIEEFQDRVVSQKITNERIGKEELSKQFADLVVSDVFLRRIGPAVNSGRALLLYGPPGNGKTSIAERMSRIYADIIYIPHAIEVDGQIIKVYDPSIHKEVKSSHSDDGNNAIRKEALDRRYVACKRPIIITGGELTLEMLDLRYDESAKYYEAPLHMKALGGTFIIDDFGRQLVKPEQLLNRWIVPLESRVDFLKLHTGKTFSIPFDEIVVFSTNLEPNDLMDPAFLRRIPYKLEIKAPSREEYRRIFRLIATQRNVEMPDDVATLVIEELQTNNGFQLACYQPRFVVDQVIAACKYLDIPTNFSPELVLDALGNMYVSGTWSQKVTSIAA
jgi:SpoVK/Ycf46/Vps4 family AAA+-type ATPase